MNAKTVLVLGGYDGSLINFRGPLLRAVVHSGYNVIGAAPSEAAGTAQKLEQMGVRFASVTLARAGLNPWRDAITLIRLKKLFLRERPEVVLSYTIKPVIYGSLAASWAGVPRIYALITGLGAAFHTIGFKGRLLRFIAVRMYRLALVRCAKVLVQNKEIAELFVREGIVEANKVVVVPGSGIDVDHYALVPLPKAGPVFLLLARMLRDKGVEEYVAAARLLKTELPDARFLLIGDTDSNPAAIGISQLNEWNQEGVIEYRSAVSDVRPLLSVCSVYVLPSYHEGLPRSILEAMAVGRPVITTDTIGCRETITNAGIADVDAVRTGENGLLVPVRSVKPLAAAMLRLARNPALCAQMARKGRAIAEQQFDVQKINALMLRVMELSPAPAGSPIIGLPSVAMAVNRHA